MKKPVKKAKASSQQKSVAKKTLAKKGKKSGFVYRKRSEESVAKRGESTQRNFESGFKGGVDFFRPKNGENVVRILPPTWDDPEHFGYDIQVHTYIGPDGDTFLCRKGNGLNKPCACCAAAKEAQSAGDKEEAKKLYAKDRVAYYLIDRNADNPEPQIWVISKKHDEEISQLLKNARTGAVLHADHPNEGYDLSFRKSGSGLRTQYTGHQFDRDASAISDDEKEMETILEEITEKPIPSLLMFRENSQLEEALAGTAEEEDEDIDEEEIEDEDEEEERPTKKSKGKAASKKKKPVDEDEEEEEEEEEEEADESESNDEDEDEEGSDEEDEEEEEEEEQPRRSSKKKPAAKKGKKRQVEEDEDEEEEEEAEEEEEEEEEERPTRRGKRRQAEEEEEEEEEEADEESEEEEEEEESEEEGEEEADEEEEEEEDEEEEEAPRRRSAKKKPAAKKAPAKKKGVARRRR